jgi:hypothetical protein
MTSCDITSSSIYSCSFSSCNSTQTGGGIHTRNFTNSVSYSSVSFRGCQCNSEGGGGVRYHVGSFTLSECEFSSCLTTNQPGAGMYATTDTGKTFFFYYCFFNDNNVGTSVDHDLWGNGINEGNIREC